MKTPTPTKKPAARPELRNAARTIARSVWTANFIATNPDATAEERGTAWKAVRKDQVKLVMRALKKLERGGAMTLAEIPAGKAAA